MSIKFQAVQEFHVAPFATPNPRVPGCVVPVSLFNFDLSEVPEVGSKLSAAKLNIVKKSKLWDDHEFLKLQDGPPGFILFIFGPPRQVNPDSTLQQIKPTWLRTDSVSWPNILFDISVSDRRSGDYYYFDSYRFAWIDGAEYETQIEVQEFISAVPFTPLMVKTDNPIATPIDARWRGNDIKFPLCLHPQVIVPYTKSGYASGVGEYVTHYDLVANSLKSQPEADQVFPATNHLRWRRYVKSFRVIQQPDGLFYGIRETCNPPKLPKTILI